MQLLIAGRARAAHHGPKIRERSRAEGKAPWADKVLEMQLICYKEPCKKVVLEAARGIIICQQGGNRRWSDSLWLSQGDREFRQGWLIPLPGHLEHKVRTPASLK